MRYHNNIHRILYSTVPLEYNVLLCIRSYGSVSFITAAIVMSGPMASVVMVHKKNNGWTEKVLLRRLYVILSSIRDG